jgi:hypothetical protein
LGAPIGAFFKRALGLAPLIAFVTQAPPFYTKNRRKAGGLPFCCKKQKKIIKKER